MSADSLIVDYEPSSGSEAAAPTGPVYGPEGRRIGRIIARIRLPEDPDESFYLVSLGSAPRMGDDRRVVPASLVVAVEPGPRLQVLVEASLVTSAPIYVEGPRCHCSAWLQRVHRHFAQAAPPGSATA